MEIRRYIIQRAITAFAIFLVILTLNFIIFHTIPSDPVKTLFKDSRMSPEDLQRMRVLFGLDKSLWDQYLIYMKNSLTGEMGVSFSYYREPVSGIVGDRLMNTLILVGS